MTATYAASNLRLQRHASQLAPASCCRPVAVNRRQCLLCLCSLTKDSSKSLSPGFGHQIGQRRDSQFSSRGPMPAAAASAAGPASHDLLIVGPGVLGSYIGQLWLQAYPHATVVGQTNTDNSHDRLRKLGVQPRLKSQAEGARKFPFVVFCAPPSGSDDYTAEIQAAARLWDGSGTLLFTSSAGVYSCTDGTQCNEDSPVYPRGESERTDRLLSAEEAVLSAGGCVVRLVGLYHAQRGAHTFYLRQGRVPRWPGYTVNLIHYEDAASLSVAILRGDGREGDFYRNQVFVGADGSPMTLQEIMDATIACPRFQGQGAQVEFTGAETEDKGKCMSNKHTRELLGWAPKYPSFDEFMAAGAEDAYSQSEWAVAGAPHK